MRQIYNLEVTERAQAIFRRQQELHRADPPLPIALHYMPTFVNADGSAVEGFAPGYTIDFVAQPPEGAEWLRAKLPDGTEFRFMPKFVWRADETYLVDQASDYTLSLGPPVRR
jgi:hypothetical protein